MQYPLPLEGYANYFYFHLINNVSAGANDVSMIQMADVGVGICGQEGRQAVMASDFAMGQFRFLKRLLLVHGHWNYQRIGYLVLYNFYRNAVFVLMLFWYAKHPWSLCFALSDNSIFCFLTKICGFSS